MYKNYHHCRRLPNFPCVRGGGAPPDRNASRFDSRRRGPVQPDAGREQQGNAEEEETASGHMGS